MIKGFRDFILRGNVVDLAVGVIIGAAFNGIVGSLVKDILTQFIAAIVGKPDFSGVVFKINGSPIYIGNFLNAAISFLIHWRFFVMIVPKRIAVCLFLALTTVYLAPSAPAQEPRQDRTPA